MLKSINIPRSHSRAKSLRIREKLVRAYRKGIVVPEGLIAHGRGEAFDYIIGERTTWFAQNAIQAAVAAMLSAERPVISVNGNVAALVPDKIAELADALNAALEVNLFYRTTQREEAIAKVLKDNGARDVLGVGKDASATLPELNNERGRVDPKGILVADAVMVSLEDGDRTETLRKMGKTVIVIDLNPFSRTSLAASISIVDNIIRAVPLMIEEAKLLTSRRKRSSRLKAFSNEENLNKAFRFIGDRLQRFGRGSRNV